MTGLEQQDINSSQSVRVRNIPSRPVAFLAGLVLLLGVFFGYQILTMQGAAADDYPSWADVEQARKDEKAAATKIKQIEGIIANLEKEIGPLREVAERAGEIYAAAMTKFDEAVRQAELLQSHADDAAATADASAHQAGLLASQMARSGGGDLTLSLFLNGEKADTLLYQLGTMGQLSNQTAMIFAQATADKNLAQSLSDQAVVAQDALKVLADEAEAALVEAQKAQKAVEDKLESQQASRATLNAQLITLKENRRETEEGYLAWVKAQTGSGGFLDTGKISSQGWVRPVVGGYITSDYGNRGCAGPYCGFHSGTDFGGLNPAGGSCNAPIYAAAEGTVTFAGWYDSMSGNQIIISHGNGIVTWYAHLMTGKIIVKNGQKVLPGQKIAEAGTTGASLGCHLHLEFRQNGQHYNPRAKFADRGITL
ncbi:MAG: peptidoglycan DD-metalloendopeptidase family protein [Microbacteriaceae bacterium]